MSSLGSVSLSRSLMPDGVGAAAESVAGLSMDSSTAEAPSKNALKKELKKKQKEEEKRLKEEEKKKKAAVLANSQSQKPSATEDEDMDPTQYYENRLKVLASLKAGGVNPYPHKFHVSMSVVEYVEKYGEERGAYVRWNAGAIDDIFCPFVYTIGPFIGTHMLYLIVLCC